MTIISAQSHRAGLPEARRMLGLFGRMLAALRAAHCRETARRQYRHLLECEPRILKDVGLSRSDVRRVMGR